MIVRLRALPKIVEEALPAVAREVEQIIAGNIDAQRGPDGVPWPRPADRTESIVLRNAMKSISVKAIGNVILARVSGPEARHHLGIAKGRTTRPLIPTKKLPQPFVEAMRRVIERRVRDVFK